MWEVLNTVFNKKEGKSYEEPYSEYPNLMFDYQIIIQVSKQNLRPTIHPGVPENIKEMIVSCWDQKPENRLTFDQIIEKLSNIKENLKN